MSEYFPGKLRKEQEWPGLAGSPGWSLKILGGIQQVTTNKNVYKHIAM